jgi:4-amino-4-deoxy-L-arabinose transferase-like glycosyltransferase
VLTIFFLERDRLRFGRSFWLAAFTCGLATAIKLQGVFFILTIPAYLLVGLAQKKISLRRTTLAGLGFVLLMSATVVVSNPFLLYQSQREKLVRVQADKQQEIAVGYTHDDPTGYQKGPQFWEWTLNRMYGSTPLLLLLAAGLVCGCIWGSRKGLHLLILSWSIPLTLYLFYFVAPKPDHYWLPIMLPLFSCALTPLELLFTAWKTSRRPWLKWASAAALALAALGLLYWFGANLSYDIPHWIEGVSVN